MKFPSVFISACLTLFVSKSLAGQVDVAQWIPWSFISSEIQKFQLPAETSIATWDLQWQEWKPRAVGADIEFKGSISSLAVNENGIQADAQSLSLQINIQQLLIDQIIQENVNGNLINIRVQAQCEPFQLQIRDFSVRLGAPFLRQGALWGPHLSDLQIDLPSGSWSVSPLHCQGPQGLDQWLDQNLLQALQNPQSLQNVIRQWLAPRMEQLWQQKWQELTGKAWEALHIEALGDPENLGFFLYGSLDVSAAQEVPLPPTENTLLSPEHPQLLLSQEGFAALIKDSVSRLSFANFDLRQISGFAKLMRSRIFQFFLWPDLMKFAKSAGFFLSTSPGQTQMDLQPSSDGDMGTWSLRLQTAGVLRGERDGELRDYIRWGVGMKGHLRTEVTEGQLLLTTTDTQVQLDWSFDNKYLSTFHPKTRIAKSVIQAAKENLFENRRIAQPLPTLNWQGRVFKLSDWHQQGSLILLNWK